MSRLSPGTGISAKALRFAVTGALAAAMLTACAGSKQLARAGDHAQRSSEKWSRAIDEAEQQVAQSPNDAATRFALGQTYLEAGRFQSAATTFADAIALGDTSGRTQLSLALARIGAGDVRGAAAVLDEARDSIEPIDRGLALALAGETGRGVDILLNALREGENTPKLRQNLAFAYALDGRWREARITMAQDVPADRINDRIGEWAMMSQPQAVQRRVASLLGVPMGVSDAGQPAALALGRGQQDSQLAGADTAAPAVETAAVDELPPIDAEPAPAMAEATPAPVSTGFAAAFVAPQPGFVSQPVVQPVPQRVARTAFQAAAAAAPAARRGAESGGTHLVQLGSFSSEANARRAWQVYTARNPELRRLQMTITPAVVRGKSYWRVAAGGLDGSAALRLCSGVRNRGGNCLAYAAERAPFGAKPAFALAGAAKARR